MTVTYTYSPEAASIEERGKNEDVSTRSCYTKLEGRKKAAGLDFLWL